MKIMQLEDAERTYFPTGRNTRVLIGAHSPVQAENFVMGYVELDPGGSVPMHEHIQEEVYYIVKGAGSIEVGDETKEVRTGDAIYIPTNKPHCLTNTSENPMTMMFVYSPGGTVKHWEEEKK